MREARAIMGDLAVSGLSPDQMALMMELAASLAMEARPSVDAQAERRRAKDRDRKRVNPPRNSAESTESAEAKIPPNDIYSNPPEPLSAKADCPPGLEDRVVSAWNETAETAGLPQSRLLNPKRKAALRARAKEHGEAAVFEAIRNTGRSKFHCGENDRGWKADLGWLLTSPEKFQKMLEVEPAARPVAGAHSALFASANRMRKAA